ncbi:MAG: outer membrane beta-barrel protein [Pseudomonadota bacterium]
MRLERSPYAKVLLVLLLITFPKVTLAQAVGSSYFGMAGGAVFYRPNEIMDHELDFDSGFVVSGLAGYIFGSVRTEAEISYGQSSLDFGNRDEELTTLRGTVSLHVDFIGTGSTNILPYAGIGVGVASLAFDDEIDDDDLAITGHGELGVAFAAASSFDIVVAYRFEHFETDIGDVEKDVQAHQVRMGIRFF